MLGWIVLAALVMRIIGVRYKQGYDLRNYKEAVESDNSDDIFIIVDKDVFPHFINLLTWNNQL